MQKIIHEKLKREKKKEAIEMYAEKRLERNDYWSQYQSIFDYLLIHYREREDIMQALKELERKGYNELRFVIALKDKKPYLDTVKNDSNFLDILKDTVINHYKK